ncbi:MAG TPA: hypothetical protein VOB72_26055 [Candidatus Dormibacteraeota bacterium]|nr:hypothetical protein [Candidatus Dormibacteraeota bacterium]
MADAEPGQVAGDAGRGVEVEAGVELDAVRGAGSQDVRLCDALTLARRPGKGMCMCMCYRRQMLDRRVQVLLDKGRYEKVSRLARRRGVPAAAVIRDAIDQLEEEEEWEARRRAIEAILAAEPMEVPDDPQELRREIDEHRGRWPR